MPTSPSACHTHALKGIRLERNPKTIIRSFLDSLKNEKPDFSSSKAQSNKLNGQFSNEESPYHFGQSLSEKYGTCRDIVGSGGTSVVWVSHKAVTGSPGKLFAIKGFRQHSSENEAEFKSRLTDEHLLLSSINHQNIIQALDLVEDKEGKLFAILELCDGGDLHSLVLQRGNLDSVEADCFFKQMMRGVDYLHKNGIAHRDLKPENIVLTRRGIVKIADFGESERFRIADVEVAMVGGMCGSSPYIAPEVHTSNHFCARSADVWSMGVIYMTMRLGRYLWITAELEDKFYSQYTQDRRTEGGYAPIENLGKVHQSIVY